jgi:HNH endonuclease
MSMKRIALSQGKYALVDDEDYQELNKYKWHTYLSTNKKYYASRNSPRIKGVKHLIKMHRMIMGCEKADGKNVDHINGDTLDNRRSNLRLCTVQENNLNKGRQINNKSGYKGVYKHSQYDVYVAQIKVGKKRIHIGVYKTAIDGAKAYDEMARIHHGEFAWQNLK